MKATLRLLVSLFFTLCVLASCEKELSVENGGIGSSTGTGVYTFTGTPDSCTTPALGGLYTVGIATSAANTVELKVTVNTVGTYSISTPQINGLTFTASGTFVATGAQTIVFTASGTPVIKGTFPYSPGNNGCSFSITVNPAAITNTAIFTFPLAPAACNPDTISGTYMAGLPLTAANTAKIQINVTKIGTYSIATAAADGFSFAASGSFINTGLQFVILTGTGKPTAGGPFSFSPGTNGCSFLITVAPPAPPATFTLENTTGHCTAPVISGTYTAGQPLTAANTVQLTAIVTVAGSYTISTNLANGISFSALGVFVTTGLQSIVFTGSGTPLANGSNNYMPNMIGACAFTIQTVAVPPVSDGVLTCKINGVFKDFSTSSGSVDYYTAAAPPTPALDELSLTGQNTGIPSEEFDLNIYKINNKIASGDIFVNTDYISGKEYTVSYTDAVADEYFALTDVPGNPSTPFKITVTTRTATRIIGSFSGTLSDTGDPSGNLKSVTEGVFNLPIQ